jgi:tryptophan-rich sensory protein
MTRRRAWIVAVPAIVTLGIASGILSNSGYGNGWFDALRKPSFMPPGWAFPVAWTTLYVLMGIAVGTVIDAGRSAARARALGLFALQLALNLAWSPLFFGLHQAKAALGLILLLDLAVVATTFAMGRVRPRAGLLLLPYWLWLALATALNAEIVRLNP